MAMKLSDIGEVGLIQRFSSRFLKTLPAGVCGIGDDCAIVPWVDDMLVEDVHFLRQQTAASDLGYKALAVNLSDIAAMAGTPLHAFLSLGLPGEIAVEWVDDFFAGLQALADAEQVNLLGGDTTRSPGPLIVNIAIIGIAAQTHIKRRTGACLNDIICVTGDLGDAAGGLRVLLDGLWRGGEEAYLVQRLTRPRAHIAEGQWLGQFAAVHTMLDVSDGIDRDLRHVLDKTNHGARIVLDQLPISEPLRQAAARHGWDAWQLACLGGEDYCLLATVDDRAYQDIADAFQAKFGRALSAIGQIVAGKTEGDEVIYLRNGQRIEWARQGFDHFRSVNG